MLTICTWYWGEKYHPDYVARLHAGVRRHLTEPFRFICFSERMIKWHEFETVLIPDLDLTKVPGCFARLRLFDPEFQQMHGIEGRIVNLDLDVIITGSLDALFLRPEPFMILRGANAANPCPYNGSIWMLRSGYRPDVWTDFSLDKAALVPFYQFADDQAWLAHKLPNENGWNVGSPSGIYAFKKPGWPKGDDLPKDARVVVFPGWRDPSMFQLSWITEHWRA